MTPAAFRALEIFRSSEGPSEILEKRAFDYAGAAGWRPERASFDSMSASSGDGYGYGGGEGYGDQQDFGGDQGGQPASGEPGGATGESAATEDTPWWSKGLDALGYGATAAAVPSAVRAVRNPTAALGAAAQGGKLMKGMGYLGTAAGAYGDLKGAITGDQGYQSDSLLGQMGEQAMTTFGNLGSAVMTGNPYAVMGAGAASAANVLSNAGRAVGDVWDAARNGGFGNTGAVKDEEVAAFKQRRAERKAQKAPAAAPPQSAPTQPSPAPAATPKGPSGENRVGQSNQ